MDFVVNLATRTVSSSIAPVISRIDEMNATKIEFQGEGTYLGNPVLIWGKIDRVTGAAVILNTMGGDQFIGWEVRSDLQKC
jgi:hypothetical protein